MGFNKRYINKSSLISSINDNKLKEFFGKTDMFIFEDTLSSEVYNLYCEGKTNQEIKEFINSNDEKNFQEN